MARWWMMAATALAALSFRPAFAEGERKPHPEPRVIVTVIDLKGAHDRGAVQHAARNTWGRIVRCYEELGGRERGKLVVRLEIAAGGKVIGVRRLDSTLNRKLAGCLADTLRRKTMPAAKSGSSVTLEVELAPGDP